MKAFKISANGTPLGVFTAETVEDALEAYANDAGYESYEALKEEHGEPNVTEVPLSSS